MAEKSGQQGTQEKQGKLGRGFTATTVYAAFGFLTALISFIFLVNPAWRPDPRERQIADLEVSAVDPGIPWGAYATRVSQSPGDEDSACTPGNVVYLKVSLQGFKHRDATLKYVTLDARDHTRVGSSSASRLKGEVTADQGVSVQWVRWPDRRGVVRYIVRFELFSDGDLLAIAETDPFAVEERAYNEATVNCLNHGWTELGFVEAGPNDGGNFDVGRWLLYGAVAVVAGLLAALAFHGTTSVLRRRRDE